MVHSHGGGTGAGLGGEVEARVRRILFFLNILLIKRMGLGDRAAQPQMLYPSIELGVPPPRRAGAPAGRDITASRVQN